MITETSGKTELLTAISEAVSQLADLVLPFDENKINTVPYKDSWTAGQLFRHITKSNNGMARAMRMETKPADRNPGERIAEFKKIFLDFSKKLNAPDFIIPEDTRYGKKAIIEDLDKSFEQLKENAKHADLNDLVEKLPLGPITKLELLHFVLYHTQRHSHQMKKISEALKNN